MAHHDFATPITDEQVRSLRVNDTVTLQRTLFGIRDATLIHMFDSGRATRFDLRGHAVIHTAPNVRKVEKDAEHPAGYAPVCIGTTTSDMMERITLGGAVTTSALVCGSAQMLTLLSPPLAIATAGAPAAPPAPSGAVMPWSCSRRFCEICSSSG